MPNAESTRTPPPIDGRADAVRARRVRDASAVAATVLACGYAAAHPPVAYMLLVAAVAANTWYLGGIRAVPVTLGTIGLVVLLAPRGAAPPLRLIVKDLPHVALFVAIVLLIGAATETLRRARRVAERHAAELRRLNEGLEREMEEVRSLSDQLHDTNQALTDALAAAERTAARAARAREEVLGVVAHDLRNPLHLVGSSAQLLMEPTLPQERREAVYAISVRAVTRMNRLIGDLLDVTRMETGRLQLDVRPCDVNRLLREGAEPFYARAAEAGIALLVAEGPAVTIPADEMRLLQLLDNLIGNALKFTPAGGRVVVSNAVASDAADGERVRVAVSDTGPGISEEHRARLFDRFWQARGNDRCGIGLGLTIAKGIVEAHGGRLWVESTPGLGSTFLFAIPASAPRP